MHFRSFDAKFFGLAIDAFTTSTLGVNGFAEGAVTIHRNASTASGFIVHVLLAAFSFLELLMIADLGEGKNEPNY